MPYPDDTSSNHTPFQHSTKLSETEKHWNQIQESLQNTHLKRPQGKDGKHDRIITGQTPGLPGHNLREQERLSPPLHTEKVHRTRLQQHDRPILPRPRPLVLALHLLLHAQRLPGHIQHGIHRALLPRSSRLLQRPPLPVREKGRQNQPARSPHPGLTPCRKTTTTTKRDSAWE